MLVNVMRIFLPVRYAIDCDGDALAVMRAIEINCIRLLSGRHHEAEAISHNRSYCLLSKSVSDYAL